MKKIFLLAALSASSHALCAQTIEAGTIALGGNVGYSQSNNKSSSLHSIVGGQNVAGTSDASSRQLYLAPVGSYFVADNLAIGLALGYANGWREEDTRFVPAYTAEQHSDYRTISLRTGAFVQYYKMLNAQFGLTGRLGAGYQRLKDSQDGYNITNGTTYYFNGTYTRAGYYAELVPGIVFFPVPKFGLTASLGAFNFNHLSLTESRYSDTSGNIYSEGAKSESNDFAASFGLDAFLLGGTYYFGR